ncbi:MAG: DUF4338 domain-containing protein, partial [Rhodospirillaceae bacterium]|nr:DUF4338 domain-containing protein [Rhodospirillaceae bacterium]
MLPGPSGGSRGLHPVRGRGPSGDAGGAPALGRVDGRAPPSRLPPAGGLRPALRCDLRVCLAAWQNGAFKCAPRDRWVGWRSAQQFRRLERVANNTRFLILSDPGVFPNLASRFLSLMTRRLSADWLAAHGHCVLLAETFCAPALFPGTMYRAAGWEGLGETKGYARANGRYTDPHGRPKEIFVTPLLSDARAQGRKHTVASVLTVHVL